MNRLKEQEKQKQMTEIQNIIEHEKLFKNLSSEEIAFLVKNSIQDNFKKNTFIKRTNNSFSFIYYLNKGIAKRGKYAISGKEFSSKMFNAKSLFGVFNLFEPNEDNEYFYQAVTNCEVLCIKKVSFLELVNKNVLFCKAILDLTIKKSIELEKNQCNLVFNNIDGKVSYFLMQLANEFGRKIGNEILIEHPFTQQDMAGFIGLTRQTINQAIINFKDKGIIAIPDRRKILIKDLQQLNKLVIF